MNSILAEIYTTVMPAAPYVIAAYAALWVVLLVYVLFITSKLKNTEKQMAVLEETLARRNAEK